MIPVEFRQKRMKGRWLRTVMLFLCVGILAHAQSSVRHVNQPRLWASIERLSEFGRPAGAGFEGGVTRIGFSEADLPHATAGAAYA
jgi:hypothetical protein